MAIMGRDGEIKAAAIAMSSTVRIAGIFFLAMGLLVPSCQALYHSFSPSTAAQTDDATQTGDGS